MSPLNSISEAFSVVEKKIVEFFSDGTLAEKIKQAEQLATIYGINLFPTAVPWTIALPTGLPISGLSETMIFAVKDIHSHLFVIAKSMQLSTAISIGINDARLLRTQGDEAAVVK